jgi:cytochrome c peroxidase
VTIEGEVYPSVSEERDAYVRDADVTQRRAKRRVPGFARAYMHNGVLHGLKEVVHFYNEAQVHGDRIAPGRRPRTKRTAQPTR